MPTSQSRVSRVLIADFAIGSRGSRRMTSRAPSFLGRRPARALSLGPRLLPSGSFRRLTATLFRPFTTRIGPLLVAIGHGRLGDGREYLDALEDDGRRLGGALRRLPHTNALLESGSEELPALEAPRRPSVLALFERAGALREHPARNDGGVLREPRHEGGAQGEVCILGCGVPSRELRDRSEARADEGVDLRRRERREHDAALRQPVHVRLAHGAYEALEQAALQAGDQERIRAGVVQVAGEPAELEERLLVIRGSLQGLDLVEAEDDGQCLPRETGKRRDDGSRFLLRNLPAPRGPSRAARGLAREGFLP